MSGVAMKWARGQKLPTPALKAMLNAIAARADDKGKTWVSQGTLADDMGCSDRRVRRLLALLQQLGVIDRVIRSKGRLGRITDEISLPLHRSFDIQKSALPTGQRVPVKSESSNRTKQVVPTGQRVPGNSKGITDPYHEEESSVVREDTYTHVRGDDPRLSDREHSTLGEVIPFRMRGAA